MRESRAILHTLDSRIVYDYFVTGMTPRNEKVRKSYYHKYDNGLRYALRSAMGIV